MSKLREALAKPVTREQGVALLRILGWTCTVAGLICYLCGASVLWVHFRMVAVGCEANLGLLLLAPLFAIVGTLLVWQGHVIRKKRPPDSEA